MELAYPTLVQLLGAHFQDDRMVDAESTDEALAEKWSALHPWTRSAPRCASWTRCSARGCASRSSGTSSSTRFGCHIAPEREGLDASAWLAKVRESIGQRIRTTGE